MNIDEDVLRILHQEDLYYTTESKYINEMAKLDGGIIVHNENDSSTKTDQLKFAHFHYKNIHFKFSKNLPKNVSQLRKLIAFDKEQKLISDNELTQLAKILKSKPTRPKKTKAKTVYEAIIDIWELLNERDADFVD